MNSPYNCCLALSPLDVHIVMKTKPLFYIIFVMLANDGKIMPSLTSHIASDSIQLYLLNCFYLTHTIFQVCLINGKYHSLPRNLPIDGGRIDALIYFQTHCPSG